MAASEVTIQDCDDRRCPWPRVPAAADDGAAPDGLAAARRDARGAGHGPRGADRPGRVGGAGGALDQLAAARGLDRVLTREALTRHRGERGACDLLPVGGIRGRIPRLPCAVSWTSGRPRRELPSPGPRATARAVPAKGAASALLGNVARCPAS